MKLIPAGIITGSHGVKGSVKVRVLVQELSNIFAYNLYDKNALKLQVQKLGGTRDMAICSINFIDSPEKAKEQLGRKLYLNRLELPAPEKGKFYKSDLLGLRVCNKDGRDIGLVESIENFGAGEIVIIRKSDGRMESYPLIEKFFPKIEEGCLTLADVEVI